MNKLTQRQLLEKLLAHLRATRGKWELIANECLRCHQPHYACPISDLEGESIGEVFNVAARQGFTRSLTNQIANAADGTHGKLRAQLLEAAGVEEVK